jgi:negative regulator of sigma E activity
VVVYSGFAAVDVSPDKDGSFKMFFSDGLNRFSVFRRPAAQNEKVDEKAVLYGNYIYSKIANGHVYTAVGTVPYSTMQDIVARVESK